MYDLLSHVPNHSHEFLGVESKLTPVEGDGEGLRCDS